MPPISRHKLSVEERQQLLLAYYDLRVTSAGHAGCGTYSELATRFHIAPSTAWKTIQRIRRRIHAGRSDAFADAYRCGRPRKWTDSDEAAARKYAAKCDWEFTYAEMGAELGFGTGTVYSRLREVGWKERARGSRPRLTEAQKAVREKWSIDMANNKWSNYVDVDEKLFYTKQLKRKVKYPADVPPPRDYPQSKSNVPHTMFLTAVALPRSRYKFNGRVGIWRVAKEQVAIRSSKHHQAGDVYSVDTTMNCALFRKLMLHSLFPAIRRKMRFAAVVTVQVDGASSHTGKNTLSILNRMGRRKVQKGPLIKVIKQPAQSPDMNVNDILFYRSISTRVRAAQRGAKIYDKEGLIENLMRQWRRFPSSILVKGFELKTKLLKLIRDCKGGNDYILPH